MPGWHPSWNYAANRPYTPEEFAQSPYMQAVLHPTTETTSLVDSLRGAATDGFGAAVALPFGGAAAAGAFGGAAGGTAGLTVPSAAGGTAAAGGSGAAASGGGMGFDLGGGLTVDEFGNITGASDSLSTVGSGDFFNPMDAGGGLNFGGLDIGGLFSGVGDALSGLGGMLPDKTTMMRLLPGLMALGYAGRQPGIDTGPLNDILGRLGGNQDAIVKAATDPLQMNIAAGYGDLLQSQSKRGIRGSSFGDTDIANYLATTGNTLANAGANAAEGSLALQGNLAGNVATLKNQGQQIKNSLFGNAFDVLGRGLNPSGYAGNINIGGGTGATPGAPSSPTLPLSSLLSLGGGLWSGLKGLGGLFSGGGGSVSAAGASDLGGSLAAFA